MPEIKITAAEATAAMALGASAPTIHHERFSSQGRGARGGYRQGFNTIPRFVGIEETKTNVSTSRRTTLRLEGVRRHSERRNLSDLINNRENAKTQHTRTLELRAERIALDLE
jgi:hypothetical protein